MQKTVILFLFALSFAHAKDTLAILPFTGGQGGDGELIAELFSFQQDLTAVFNPVPRVSVNQAIRNEPGFRIESGMTDPDTIAALGKQLGAAYVAAGTITPLGDRNLLIIAVLHTETLRQIAGDMQTYAGIGEIDGTLQAMARNIAAAVEAGADAARLPLLALPPVRLEDGTDSREADALAQVLAVRLVRSGKYAVYPRAGSLERMQEKHGALFSADMADEYLPLAEGPTKARFVLSVSVWRLEAGSIFNAALINFETGIQEAGDSVDYRNLEDGIEAMGDLALVLSGQGIRADAARHNLAAGNTASFSRAAAVINNDSSGGRYTITLTDSFSTPPVTFTGGAAKTITIIGDEHNRTISNTGIDSLINLPEGITLVLDNNVTLNGNFKSTYVVFVNGGALVMKSGSTVRGSLGGGVYIMRGGAFTMSGGDISGNSASLGGGVRVSSDSTFTMSGGAISGNSAVTGGGGVYVFDGAFMMSGGAISGNSAPAGGGVYVSGGTFIKSGGGTIDAANTSQIAGRGPVAYVEDGDKRRGDAAGPGVNLDSRLSGSAGGWE